MADSSLKSVLVTVKISYKMIAATWCSFKNMNVEVQDDQFHEHDAGDGTSAKDQYLYGIRLIFCVTSLAICMFLASLDQTIVVTILATIGNKFNAFDRISWLASGFLLSMAVFASTWGKLSIAIGRKWTMIISIILFELGSLVCGTANNFDTLIGGRVLAGVGGGGIQCMVFVLISEFVPISKRPLIIACFGIIFSISSIFGPLIGGAFTKTSWRWCFYINLPLAGVAILFLVVTFHPPKPQGSILKRLHDIDYIGIILLTTGLVLTLLGISFGGIKFAWKSAVVVCCLVFGAILLIGFAIWNFKFSQDSILPPEILSVSQINASSISLFCTFFVFLSTAYYVAAYLQVVQNMSALQSGIALLPMIVSVCITSVLTGIATKTTRYVKPFLILGACIGPIGVGLLLLLGQYTTPTRRIGLLIPIGISIGLQIQPGIIVTQLRAPQGVAGSMIMTTAYVNFMRTLGGALGAELGQTVFNVSFKNKLLKAVNEHPELMLNGFNPSIIGKLESSPQLIQSLPSIQKELVFKTFIRAQHDIYYMGIGIACLGIVCTLFTTNRRLPKSLPRESHH